MKYSLVKENNVEQINLKIQADWCVACFGCDPDARTNSDARANRHARANRYTGAG